MAVSFEVIAAWVEPPLKARKLHLDIEGVGILNGYEAG
jgi:hypothetical protein